MVSWRYGGPRWSLFIFKIGSTLGTADSSQILLTNGARMNNVFWQVGTAATLGGSSTFAGNVLANSSYITVGDGASVDGRLLARTAYVTLDGNNAIAIPEPATTTALMAVGVLGLIIAVRTRRRRMSGANGETLPASS